MLVSGATRTGKTYYLQLDVTQAIERGNEAVIFIDPKGDLKVLHRAYDAAVRTGREKDFLFFSLAFPHLSCTYDPLHNFVLGMEIPDRLAGLLPGGGQSEPFKAFAWEVINVIAQAMLLAGERPLLSKIARYAKVTATLEELLPRVPEETPESEFLRALIKHPPDHYDKMVSSLKPLLSKLDTPDFRNLMSVSSPELDWDRAIRNKRIVYMFMGSMIVKETAYAIGMLALQDLLNFIGRAYAYEQVKTPVRLIVDEVGRLVFPGFVDLLSQAGGQGLMVVLAFQSVADLESVLGKAGAQQILDNTNTKLWFRATDYSTAKTFPDIGGQGPLLTRRQSASYRPMLHDRRAHGQLGFDATFSEQSTELIENLVREDWLMKLPRGHASSTRAATPTRREFPCCPSQKIVFLWSDHEVSHRLRLDARCPLLRLPSEQAVEPADLQDDLGGGEGSPPRRKNSGAHCDGQLLSRARVSIPSTPVAQTSDDQGKLGPGTYDFQGTTGLAHGAELAARCSRRVA
jgi:hypothetical protein